MSNIFSPSDKDSIFSYWPMPESTPRLSQNKVLEWISKLPSDIKYILAEIPVGGGKSPLALNLSGYLSRGFGDAYVITPQKILQKQYEDSFDKRLIHSLYGKSNYTCESKNTNCEIGSDIKPKCSTCPHRDAFIQVRNAPNVVLNYTLALNLFKYIKDDDIVRRRSLIVFDEAHALEGHLTEFNAMVFSEYRCKQLGIQYKNIDTMSNAFKWIRESYVPALGEKIKKLSAYVDDVIARLEHEGTVPTKDDLHQFNLLRELERHLTSINENIISKTFDEVNEEYVFVSEGKTSFKLKLLFGDKVFKEIIDPMADRILFMSSTILNKEAYCEDLGIDPKKTAFISVDSEFDVDNRPIFVMPVANMSYGWDGPERKVDRSNMIKRITHLCNNVHPDENGVIHAGSFQIAKWLVEELEGKVPHRIMHHNPGCGFTRDAVVDDFQQVDSYPKLLISPSVTEGLDLKDDKGRFAIFAKVPYPYLGDAWVKRRMAISNEWYVRQALISMIQGGGRVVRTNTDWGHVYILDSTFQRLLHSSKKFLPTWWKTSIQ